MSLEPPGSPDSAADEPGERLEHHHDHDHDGHGQGDEEHAEADTTALLGLDDLAGARPVAGALAQFEAASLLDRLLAFEGFLELIECSCPSGQRALRAGSVATGEY